jgi:hypothetical protein
MSGNAELTVTASASGTELRTQTEPVGTLLLQGRRISNGRRVQWTEEVVDNEDLNRKKSKSTSLTCANLHSLLYIPKTTSVWRVFF